MVDFSSSNYIELGKSIWYQYKLEGFDKDWISTNQLRLIYTNLAPGNYVLKVREAKNRLGEDMGDMQMVRIIANKDKDSPYLFPILQSEEGTEAA